MNIKPLKTMLAITGALSAGYMAGRYVKRRSKSRISGPRYLIINADDFGLSDGVTEGILQAWQEGVVTSTSAMINLPGAPDRIAAAHKTHPALPIGLHLNVTAGCPVLPPQEVPTLVSKAGCFYDRFSVFQYLSAMSLDELRVELYAQAEKLLATGVTFDHIDYHQHLMVMHTPFYSLVCEMARYYGVPVRQPVPEHIHGQIKVKGGLGNGAVMQTAMTFVTRYPAQAIEMISRMIPSQYRQQSLLLENEGIKTTNWLIMALYDKAGADNFISVIRQLPPGVSEIVMHPARPDEQLGQYGGNYIKQRADELAMLLDPRVRQALLDYDITPVNFSFVQKWGEVQAV